MENNEEDFENYHDNAWDTNCTDDHNYIMAVMENRIRKRKRKLILKKNIADEKG